MSPLIAASSILAIYSGGKSTAILVFLAPFLSAGYFLLFSALGDIYYMLYALNLF